MDWKTSVKSFVDIFANLDFRNGPLFYVAGMVIAGYCCMEGYRIYKAVLGAMGFVLGFRIAHMVFGSAGLSGEALLMAETFLGLILAVVAFSVFKAGVFIAVFQFTSSNLPVYVEAVLRDRTSNPFWLFAKVFLSAAGMGIQDVKDPIV